MSISSTSMQQLIALAKAQLESRNESTEEAEKLSETIVSKNVTSIDLSLTGLPEDPLKDEETTEATVEVIAEILSNSIPSSEAIPSHVGKIAGVARDDITLNLLQQSFHDAVLAGKDVVEVGAAGTGKTTSVRKTTRSLMDIEGRLPKLSVSTKWLFAGNPGCIIVSYTRKAVNNIRMAVIEELKPNVLTMHKVLEFQPVFYETEDPANPGMFKNTMRFEPTRTKANPLPTELVCIGYEESSMIPVPLYALFQDALPHPHQEFFLGDIQQLPPVFGLSILGFKMCELEVIELTEVYRQALESPILDLAWRLLDGDASVFSSKLEHFEIINSSGKKVKRIKVPSYELLSREVHKKDDTFVGSLKIQPWQKKLTPDMALATTVKQFKAWHEEGYYNSKEDIILCPFNKAFGTIEINLGIMQFLGIERNAIVHEIIAGFNKHYLAVGDRVLFDKEDAVIVDIHRNGAYLGKAPAVASANLNRWGHIVAKASDAEMNAAFEAEMSAATQELSEDELLSLTSEAIDARVQAASHVIEIELLYGDSQVVVLDQAAEINALLGGYAITFHKAQGSEYDNGFIVLHHSHAVMNSRELLYTGITRFKKRIHIICESDTFEKGIKSQRIKGNTLDEKKELFKGKQLAGEEFDIETTIKSGKEYKVISYSRMEADGRNHERYDDENSMETLAANTVSERSEAILVDDEATRKEKLIAIAKAKLAEMKKARR